MRNCEYCKTPISDRQYSYTKWQMSFGLCRDHQEQKFIDDLHEKPYVINGVRSSKNITDESVEKYNALREEGKKRDPLSWNDQQERRRGL
jgi:hypothetical protein